MRRMGTGDRLRSVASAWRQVTRVTRQVCGIPDYDAYLEHRGRHHPGEPVMTFEEFFRNRLDARYGSSKNGGMRCC